MNGPLESAIRELGRGRGSVGWRQAELTREQADAVLEALAAGELLRDRVTEVVKAIGNSEIVDGQIIRRLLA